MREARRWWREVTPDTQNDDGLKASGAINDRETDCSRSTPKATVASSLASTAGPAPTLRRPTPATPSTPPRAAERADPTWPTSAEREIYYSRASAAIHGSPRSLGTFDQTLGCPPTTRWRGAATLAVTVWRVRSRCQSARDCRHRPTTHRGELGRAGPDRPPSQPALPGPPACGVPVRARRHEGCARGASHPSKMAYPPPACASASRARWRCSSACAASNTVHRPDEPLRSLRELIAGLIPGHSARQMTYDLRRLAARGSSSGSRAPSDTS